MKSVCWCENVYQSNWIEKGRVAQMVECVPSMHEEPGSMPGSFTLTFVFFSVKSVFWCENVYQSKLVLKGGISSNGKAHA